MSAFLKHVWSKACKIRPLVIMIDGVDQVKSYGSTSLEWVPSELPEHVKLIMTVRDDSPQMTQLQTIIEDRACFLKVLTRGTERMGSHCECFVFCCEHHESN